MHRLEGRVGSAAFEVGDLALVDASFFSEPLLRPAARAPRLGKASRQAEALTQIAQLGDRVREYLIADGKSPFREWLERLDLAVRACFSAETRARRRKTSAQRNGTGLILWGRPKMAKRSRDWNEGLARDLRNAAFAREFLMGAIEEGIPLHEALGKVIRAMGVKEFAAKVGMASPNVQRAIHPRHNPTQATLNRLLKPFRLRLSLAPLAKRSRRHAA